MADGFKNSKIQKKESKFEKTSIFLVFSSDLHLIWHPDWQSSLYAAPSLQFTGSNLPRQLSFSMEILSLKLIVRSSCRSTFSRDISSRHCCRLCSAIDVCSVIGVFRPGHTRCVLVHVRQSATLSELFTFASPKTIIKRKANFRGFRSNRSGRYKSRWRRLCFPEFRK